VMCFFGLGGVLLRATRSHMVGDTASNISGVQACKQRSQREFFTQRASLHCAPSPSALAAAIPRSARMVSAPVQVARVMLPEIRLQLTAASAAARALVVA